MIIGVAVRVSVPIIIAIIVIVILLLYKKRFVGYTVTQKQDTFNRCIRIPESQELQELRQNIVKYSCRQNSKKR